MFRQSRQMPSVRPPYSSEATTVVVAVRLLISAIFRSCFDASSPAVNGFATADVAVLMRPPIHTLGNRLVQGRPARAATPKRTARNPLCFADSFGPGRGRPPLLDYLRPQHMLELRDV